MPTNIAHLLSVVRILLEYGRHLAATMERRAAAPGFGLFSALFGTVWLPVILAHLNRGLLRATVLESLLLQRAAAGRDVETAPHPPAAPRPDAGPDPVRQPLPAQIERLTADRAQYDAPIDPAHLPAREQIESEVHARPIGRTVADICRDLGVVPALCTSAFWAAVTKATACREVDAATAALRQHAPRKPEQRRQEPEDPQPQQPGCVPHQEYSISQQNHVIPEQEYPASQQNDRARQHTDPAPQREDSPSQRIRPRTASNPHRTLKFTPDKRPVDPFRDTAPPANPRHIHVPLKKPSRAAPRATGPPRHAAMQLAA